MIYFDHNATTPLRADVLEAMEPFLKEAYGNPSSVHEAGRIVADRIDEARVCVAGALHVRADEIHFTSGGTEADNWALKGVMEAEWLRCQSRGALLTSTAEHPAVLDSAAALARRGYRVEFHAVDGSGLIDVDRLLSTIDRGPTPTLVSLLHANNETGVIQPLAQIGPALRKRGILFHVDAVQSFGKVEVQPESLGADLISLSAHKINGPKGSGALYVRSGVEIEPLLHGGGQEAGRRPGTLHAAGIVGLGAATRLAEAGRIATAQHLQSLRDRLQAGLIEAVGDVEIHGGDADRLVQTLNVSFTGVEAEAVLLGLDQLGIAAASGSACTAGQPEPSHVLLAMGVEPRQAASAIRFSLGWGNDEAQVDEVLDVLPPIIARLRAMSVF